MNGKWFIALGSILGSFLDWFRFTELDANYKHLHEIKTRVSNGQSGFVMTRPEITMPSEFSKKLLPVAACLGQVDIVVSVYRL